jgi:hypothetical protein
MTSAVVLAQGLPLWALLLAFFQNRNPKRFPDGTGLPAKPPAGCEPVRSGSRVPPPPTRRELSPSIPTPRASRPTTGSDAAVPGIGSLPASQCPAVISTIPTRSATPATAHATDADSAIRLHHPVVGTGRGSRAPTRPESNAGIRLPGSLSPHTTATDAASLANGSWCDHNVGTDIAAPTPQSIPR